MANLKISEKWNAGIYQLETTDPVMGGEDGIDNVQARQLAENIFYMRQRGIADWNGDLNYIKNSFVLYDNKLYQSTVDNNKNKQPSESSKEWSLFLQTASTSAPGLIQLSSSTSSISETTAATSKAVKAAYDLANTANITANTAKTNVATAQTKADSAYTLANTANTTANTAKSTAETDASTTVKGRVQLSSTVNSTAENQAATPGAVKKAYDLANTANTTANTAKTNATTAQTKADSAYTLANTANTTANTAKSTAETDASTTVKGRVQLNSAVNSTVENQAATPKAVKTAYDLANGRLPLAGGTVTGTTNFTGKLQQAGSDVITNTSIKSLFENKLTDSGYQKLPNGLILQWGNVLRNNNSPGNYSITFPISYPNSCLTINCTPRFNSNPNTLGADAHNAVGAVTKSSMVVRQDSNQDSLYWLAIGY